jgi:carboxyl-terminal processing protease
MKARMLLVLFCLIILRMHGEFALCDPKISFQESYDDLCATIEKYFYSKDFISRSFAGIKGRYRDRAAMAHSEEGYKETVRDMLRELKVSHTAFYMKDDPEYYQLASIFRGAPDVKKAFPDGKILYPSIGILTARIGGKLFVSGVLEGGPASKAGILKGDEIVSADGQPYKPIKSLSNKAGRMVRLQIRRAWDKDPFDVSVFPAMINPSSEFLIAQEKSAALIPVNGKSIGYIHIWCYAGQDYQNAFIDAISQGPLAKADALILDLRDGWGGASPDYLNIFNRNVPTVTLIDREGRPVPFNRQWWKPVVMLVNGGSRSGKEILAYGFRKFNLGVVMGEKTAGAVMGGRSFILKDGSLLYLAVASALVDGTDLEGVGVSPDIEVPMDIRFSAGLDLQKQKALEYLAGRLQSDIEVPGSPCVLDKGAKGSEHE